MTPTNVTTMITINKARFMMPELYPSLCKLCYDANHHGLGESSHIMARPINRTASADVVFARLSRGNHSRQLGHSPAMGLDRSICPITFPFAYPAIHFKAPPKSPSSGQG